MQSSAVVAKEAQIKPAKDDHGRFRQLYAQSVERFRKTLRDINKPPSRD